ncbi:WD repeat-containing protein 59 [Stylophora pistillata]|uniref:WD repeat-containing protein 59 n=1 Tax=Stylophora pistillata TaxID=50429 RepID=A0A2B4T214_STYPI|nr:WD repeat-containing protein 59 [Stylophora pistillata]
MSQFKMAAYQDLVAPHKDLPATVMAVDCTGQFSVLGSRKGLAFIDLNAPHTITKKVSRNSKWECGAVEWNPHLTHAHIFAYASNQKTEIWSWRDGNNAQQHILRGHTRSISDLNWSWFDPQLLATCSMDQFIYIWDLRDAKKPASSLQAIVGASQVKWNRVNRHVLATSHEGDVRIWDLRKGNTPVVYVTAHLSKIHGLDWSRSSGTTLATCSNDTFVKLWNTENPRQPEYQLKANSPVWRARFTPFGEGLVTVTVPPLRRGENSLSLWNILNISSPVPSPVNTFVGHSDVVLEFQWRSQIMEDEEQFQLITWAKDQTLRMWAMESKWIMACSGDVTANFPSETTGTTSPTMCDDLIESAISESVIIGSADVIPVMAAQPHTLQQEFALINVNYPNVIVEQMDAGHRSCTVNVTNGRNVVSLLINFPAHYPNNAIPSFEFTPDSSIDLSTKTKLMKLQEDLPMDPFRPASPIHGRLDPVSYGSYSDAAIPFPRTSGAKFCACGLLVCFNLPGRYSGRVGSGGEPTPRSLSAFSAYSSRPSGGPALPPLTNSSLQKYRPTFGAFGQQSSARNMMFRSLNQQQGDLHDAQKYGGVTSRSSDVGPVVIRDVSALMPIHQSLGQAYTLEGKKITEICKKNLAAAMTTGRKDLVQTWSLLSSVLDKKLAPTDSMDETPWALHPFGRKMIKSLMDYYLGIRDIQMLGMLACVLAHPSLPEPFKPPKVDFKPEVVASSKLFTYGSSSSQVADTPYQSNKRPKSVGGVITEQPADMSPAEEQWSEISFPYSGGWSPPVFIRAQSPRDEQRKQYEKDCRFVDSSELQLHDHYMNQYADVLYRWNLLGKRAEVIKFLSEPQKPHSGVEFSTRCYNCPQMFRGAQCGTCKALGFQCVICHVAVRGASNFCVACGHGGHTYHLMTWFETMDVCPTGCGCRCLEVGTFIVD